MAGRGATGGLVLTPQASSGILFPGNTERRAFSLVELLLVIAVISLIIAIILPAAGAARSRARAAGSMSNLRQWGIGLVSFATDQRGKLPWEGYKNANQMPANFTQELRWANCIPPYVGQKPYRQLCNEASQAGLSVPMPPDGSNIFIDPSAQVPSGAPYTGGGKKFFFYYVPNAQLDATLEQNLIA